MSKDVQLYGLVKQVCCDMTSQSDSMDGRLRREQGMSVSVDTDITTYSN